MIALTYYDALSKSTDSPVLKSICEQMLHDELPHIMFQSHTLQYFKNGPAFNFARMIVMEITSFFVWSAFRDVFRAGGYCLKPIFKRKQGVPAANRFNFQKNKISYGRASVPSRDPRCGRKPHPIASLCHKAQKYTLIYNQIYISYLSI